MFLGVLVLHHLAFIAHALPSTLSKNSHRSWVSRCPRAMLVASHSHYIVPSIPSRLCGASAFVERLRNMSQLTVGILEPSTFRNWEPGASLAFHIWQPVEHGMSTVSMYKYCANGHDRDVVIFLFPSVTLICYVRIITSNFLFFLSNFFIKRLWRR